MTFARRLFTDSSKSSMSMKFTVRSSLFKLSHLTASRGLAGQRILPPETLTTSHAGKKSTRSQSGLSADTVQNCEPRRARGQRLVGVPRNGACVVLFDAAEKC